MEIFNNGSRSLGWWSEPPAATQHATPVVFLHAYPLDSSMWESQRRLSDVGIHVYAYDMFGFGKSAASTVPGDYTIEHLVADLHSFLENVVRRPSVVCGLSLGGYVTLRAALSKRGLIAGLVLADVGAGSDAPAEFRSEVAAWADAYEASGFDAYLERLFQEPLFGDTQALGAEIADRLVATMRSNPQAGVVNTARYVIADRTPVYDLAAGIGKLSLPTLILVGEDDEKCIQPARFLHQTIKHSALEPFQGCGHFINIERATRFNDLVARFAAQSRP